MRARVEKKEIEAYNIRQDTERHSTANTIAIACETTTVKHKKKEDFATRSDHKTINNVGAIVVGCEFLALTN